jgi:hypothetical protein
MTVSTNVKGSSNRYPVLWQMAFEAVFWFAYQVISLALYIAWPNEKTHGTESKQKIELLETKLLARRPVQSPVSSHRILNLPSPFSAMPFQRRTISS